MFGTQCGSLPPCVHLSSLGCCAAGLLLLILHPSSLTVVAPYSDDACAEILLVTVLIVEQSLSQAVTQLHVHERLCHLHTLDDPLRPREDISASHPIPVPRAPESILHIECTMTGNTSICAVLLMPEASAGVASTARRQGGGDRADTYCSW